MWGLVPELFEKRSDSWGLLAFEVDRGEWGFPARATIIDLAGVLASALLSVVAGGLVGRNVHSRWYRLSSLQVGRKVLFSHNQPDLKVFR